MTTSLNALILKLVNIPDFLDYLSMQNALLGESNRFISEPLVLHSLCKL
jgi:hypothetical protein